MPPEVHPEKKKLKKLGWESLQLRRWYQKLCCFYKILKNKPPNNLFNLIPASVSSYRTRNAHNIPQIRLNYDFFKNFFLSINDKRMEQT